MESPSHHLPATTHSCACHPVRKPISEVRWGCDILQVVILDPPVSSTVAGNEVGVRGEISMTHDS